MLLSSRKSPVVVQYKYYFISSRFKSASSAANLYQVLGISQNASLKEIKTAYYKKCKENHPDISQTKSGSHDKFLQVQKAYDILSQVSTRKAYDISLQRKTAYGGPLDPTYTSYSQKFYTNNSMNSYQYQEFERYMRNQQKYRNDSPYQTRAQQNSMNFDSPLRVMVVIIVLLAIFEMYTVSFIYDRDTNRLHTDNHMGFSPLNRHALSELRRQVHHNLDPSDLERKIEQIKSDEK